MVFVRDVRLGEGDRLAKLLDALLTEIDVPVEDHDLGAALQKQTGGGVSETGGATRNEGYFSVEVHQL